MFKIMSDKDLCEDH